MASVSCVRTTRRLSHPSNVDTCVCVMVRTPNTQIAHTRLRGADREDGAHKVSPLLGKDLKAVRRTVLLCLL